jgi:hypothetical protein
LPAAPPILHSIRKADEIIVENGTKEINPDGVADQTGLHYSSIGLRI